MKQRNLRSFARPETKPERRLSKMISFAITAITPVVAFFSALILIDEGKHANWIFLAELRSPVGIPIYLVQLPILGDIFLWISRLNYLKAVLLFFIGFWLVYAAIFTILYAILMKYFGPSYYGKYDAPDMFNKHK